MRVVIVGGGYAGLAAAARLAKLGHEVTLVEAADELGGALRPVTRNGFTWDGAASYTLLPGALRDLFRKSGRPLEREVDLVALPVLREHRFADGTRLALPAGTRAGQAAAVDDALGAGGAAWGSLLDDYAAEWETLRRDYLERPWAPELAPRALSSVLLTRESLARRARRLPDPRLRRALLTPVLLDGHDPRRVPAWVGVEAYVERSFGAWTVPDGLHLVRDALVRRLATRRVSVRVGSPVADLVVAGGAVRGVRVGGDTLSADAVVVAVDPRRLPALASYARRTAPVDPPALTHLGLRDAPDLPPETVLHGEPLLTVRTGGLAPTGHVAWTVHRRGPAGGDVLDLLAARGLDVRRSVVARVDRSPADMAAGGSPLGLAWDGRATVRRRLGPRTPIAGVYAAGAHAAPGSGLPFVALSAALVAQAIGPA